MIHNFKLRICVLGSNSLAVVFTVNNEIVETQYYSASGIKHNATSKRLARYFILGVIADQFGENVIELPAIPWIKICSGEYFEFRTTIAF